MFFNRLQQIEGNHVKLFCMKKIKILFLLLVGWIGLHGQEYVPLLDTNKVWNVLEIRYPGSPYDSSPDIICAYPHFLQKCETDSTRFIVKKKITGQVIDELGYLREDTVARKVYYTDLTGDNEILLYDFSLDVGDIFQGMLWPLEVLEVDSIQLHDGTLRKRIKLYGEIPQYWIEGIGNTWGGLIWTDWNPTAFHESAHLLCYFENDSILYRNELFSYDCDYCYISVNTETTGNSPIPKFYPNPFTQKVSIAMDNLLHGETLELEIKTLEGRTVYRETISSNTTLNLSFLYKGIYLLTLKNKHLQFTEKIIKL